MTTKTIELTTTHWNDLTERYDSVMSSDPAYRRLLSAIMRLLPPGCRSILDLGCGSGAVTYLCHRLLPDAEIVGLDPAPKMIEQARSRLGRAPNVSFVEGTASDLSDFATGRFDAVVSNFALHHLVHPDKRRCADEVFRVLAGGGRFINGDQHAQVMGEVSDPVRTLHILDLLTAKARYYYLNAGLDRMLLQLQLLPRFIREDGEILATPAFWSEALCDSGFEHVTVEIIEPAELMNRVIWGDKRV